MIDIQNSCFGVSGACTRLPHFIDLAALQGRLGGDNRTPGAESPGPLSWTPAGMPRACRAVDSRPFVSESSRTLRVAGPAVLVLRHLASCICKSDTVTVGKSEQPA